MPLATAEDRPVGLDPVLCIGQVNAAAPINCRASSPICGKSHLRPGKLATVAARYGYIPRHVEWVLTRA
jgi:hypothetical protein